MLLQLKNIGKIYDSNHILTVGIRGINLEFDYNEFVTIEGESGSGKSTLLNVIGANDTYEEGELYIYGHETSHYSDSDWEAYREQNIATVFQDFNIIENLTVRENIELALLRFDDPKERRRRADDLIARVGLTARRNQKGSRLSGGEKQRTVIARALAKDAPILLADEPTGNLDVKASNEIAALLKEISRDRLVIVVTHNPEFFVRYATRRIRVFDGHIAEDRVIQPPVPRSTAAPTAADKPSRWHSLRSILHIGLLNYRSRPRFTFMMSFALVVCAVTLLLMLSVFDSTLIRPLTVTLESTGVAGKAILTAQDSLSADRLDELAHLTGAGYLLPDRDLSEFTVTVPKSSGMLRGYTVTCLYDPYSRSLPAGEAVLVLPRAAGQDADAIRDTFLNAGVGFEKISVELRADASDVRLYLGYDDAVANGVRIRAINSTVTLGDNAWTVYTFEADAAVADGTVNLINSTSYEAEKYSAIFSVRSNRAYTVASASGKRESVRGLVVQLSPADFETMFGASDTDPVQACLYYPDDKTAAQAMALLPDGCMGVLSTSRVFVRGAGDLFTADVLYYIGLMAVSLCFAVLISLIFSRSVRIFRTDFAVYRTLGITRRVSARSLYVQMALIFLPTLLLLPILSWVAAVVPGSTLPLVSVGNYIFIEAMLLLIVELVALGFNRGVRGQSIRKSLGRGTR